MALKVKRIINDGIFPTSPHRDDEKFLAWIASTPEEFIATYREVFPRSKRKESAIHRLYQTYGNQWNAAYANAEDPVAEHTILPTDTQDNPDQHSTEPIIDMLESETTDNPTTTSRGKMIAVLPLDVREQEPTSVVIPHRSPVLDSEKDLAWKVHSRLVFVDAYKRLFPKSRRTYNAINQIWYEYRDKSEPSDELSEDGSDLMNPLPDETSEHLTIPVPDHDAPSLQNRSKSREPPETLTAPGTPKLVLKRRTVHTIEVWEEVVE
jgi:hypothetical protein